MNRVAIRDGNRELLAARIEASGLEVHWPSRVDIKHIVISGPRATIERDKNGESLRTLAGLEASGPMASRR